MPDFTREEVIEIVHKLDSADLEGLDLSGANLTGVNLREANLALVNLGGTDLSGADLSEAKYDNKTKLPDGFDPEEAGMVLVH